MHKTIFLYATTGCHLCEHAERLLASMPELHRFTVTVIDVVDHPGAFEKYAEHIPVLDAEGLEGVLRWPFHADQVLDFLERTGR